jgi:hypothetical protein
MRRYGLDSSGSGYEPVGEALRNTVMNLRVPQDVGKFLTSEAIGSSSKKTQIRRVGWLATNFQAAAMEGNSEGERTLSSLLLQASQNCYTIKICQKYVTIKNMNTNSSKLGNGYTLSVFHTE